MGYQLNRALLGLDSSYTLSVMFLSTTSFATFKIYTEDQEIWLNRQTRSFSGYKVMLRLEINTRERLKFIIAMRLSN
jgi:hypothetical protein